MGLAMKGKKGCRVHGGKTPGGLASPHWKHGKYSKYLPERLHTRYQEAVNDDDLLALRDEIALTRSRITELLERIDAGESGQLWRLLRRELTAFETAQKDQRVEDAATHLNEIRRLIRQGLADWAIWDDIRSNMETHRRLVESERKRLVDMQQMITAERAFLLVNRIGEIILENVSDRKARTAISKDLNLLVDYITPGSTLTP